jgi:hypothetical protein
MISRKNGVVALIAGLVKTHRKKKKAEIKKSKKR